MATNNVLKVLIGVLVILVGLWTMIDPVWFGYEGWIFGLGWWTNTWDIIKGSIGPMLLLIGIIVIWITYEEAKS